MTDSNTAFSKMVPGFDFLQGLMKNAGAAMPGVGQWIAPTLDPEELDKRIKDLRTVQFWLEQNARMMGATIQALEVQRMTLSTLQTMNVSLGDLSESLKLRMPGMATAEAPAAPAASMAANLFRATAPAPAPEPVAAAVAADAPAVPAGVIDPMQWWGALTQQFSQLAAQALKDTPAGGAHNFTDAMQQGMNTAGATLKKASEAPLAAVKKMADAAASLNPLGPQAKGAASAKAGSAGRAKAATASLAKPGAKAAAKPAARRSAK